MSHTSTKYLIVVGGPTASGKTALAIRLAQHFSTAIVSADSRQFYREMRIGTAKPTPQERAQAPHFFVDTLSIHDPYSVGDFEEDAMRVLNGIFEKNDFAVMVGGTGLYIKAICEGLDHFPEVPLSIRAEFEALYAREGIEKLQNMLQEVDKTYYEQVDKQNPTRLIRALSVWKVSGQPFSAFRQNQKNTRPFTPIYICTDWPRETLYARINQRVDHMIAEGLVEEARQLFPFRALQALQTVGYSELFDHFEGKIPLAEAIDKIKQHSRNYAKRQLTWFRKDPHWVWFDPTNSEKIIEFIEKQTVNVSKNTAQL